MRHLTKIQFALKQIFVGIAELQAVYPGRTFTIDGRLVGDIGEMIAEMNYTIQLDKVQRAEYDGTTPDGKQVQIKATFKDKLTFKTVPQLYLGLKLYQDGSFEEVFNGPPTVIVDRYGHWKNFGSSLLSFPISQLRNLAASVPLNQRIRRREGTLAIGGPRKFS